METQSALIMPKTDTSLNSQLDSSLFYTAIFRQSKQNAMLILDLEGYILQCNKAFENQFGYTANDLVGKHTRLFFTVEDQHLKKPEIEISTVKEKGVAEDNNYLVHKDGSLVWVMGESVLVSVGEQNYISKIVHSIHTQKVMERFLIDTNELIESMLATMKDGIIVVDADLRILKANKAFHEMFEIPAETIEGILIYDLNYSFWNDQGIKWKLETMIEDNEFFETNRFQWARSDGSMRILNITAKPMDYLVAKKKRTLLVISDITLEKELEQQKEDLIAFVTHELRNPLANMALCAELMEDSINDNRVEETHEYLAKTRKNIRRLSNVVSELHDATKAGSGQLKIEKQLILYEALVDEAIETVKHLHPNYEIVKSGNAAIEILADRHRILQVLNNYLTNAIKYSSDGSQIHIDLSIEGGNLVTGVTDVGSGVAKSEISNIFNRYYRVESTRAAEGLGLGLYLCKEIIAAHNGKVWVESEDGAGSTFYFSLPTDK